MEPEPPTAAETAHTPRDAREARCCIVGGGPAGLVLGYLLAKSGVPVVVLEAHKDFDREFRGDTVHPSTLEILDSLGLAERLLQLPHAKLQKLTLNSPGTSATLADFRTLRTKFPYIAMIPQVKFLDLLAEEARRLPAFHLVMGANAKELIEHEGMVCGVRYQSSEGWHEVRAALTVGADGRFSKLRSLTGFSIVNTAPPMDVLWFRLPKSGADDPDAEATFRIASGRMLIRLDRFDYWQMGYVILKGSYKHVRDEGLESLRREIRELSPELASAVETLQDWSQITPLNVESGRLRQWYRSGLLLIGDAAHVMSPVGGVGINYAIQDAVVTANLLARRLRNASVDEGDLAEVQRQREWPTRIIQTIQGVIQKQLIGRVFDAEHPFRPPLLFKIRPILQIWVRVLAFGPRRVRVDPAVLDGELTS